MNLLCLSCLWCDSCEDKVEGSCEYFVPSAEDTENEMLAAEYLNDVRERGRIYDELIEEQDS